MGGATGRGVSASNGEWRRAGQWNKQSISFQPKIPYPLNEIQQELHDRYESGTPFQSISFHHTTQRRPTSMAISLIVNILISGWVSCHKLVIYKFTTSINTSSRKIYYRPTVGNCCCHHEYDGQNDLLFKLDNKHLFYYGFMISYLHLMVEGKYPLIFYLRACWGNHEVLRNTKTTSISYLHKAWNAFTRHNWSESFQCPHSGPTHNCDGYWLLKIFSSRNFLLNHIYSINCQEPSPRESWYIYNKTNFTSAQVFRIYKGMQVS